MVIKNQIEVAKYLKCLSENKTRHTDLLLIVVI
jgi:hypothetical protein